MIFTPFPAKRFRTTSFFSLVEWNHLPSEEQNMLSGLYDSDEVYGLFYAVDSAHGRTAKIAYREVAFLYLHLQKAHTVPRCFLRMDNEEFKRILAQLVLDEILEIEESGTFVSGADAVPVLFSQGLTGENGPVDRTTAVSLNAIVYAFSLRGLTAREMAERLYTFNTAAWEQMIKDRFNASESMLAFLLAEVPKTLLTKLNEHWQFSNLTQDFPWFSWQRRNPSGFFSTQLDPTFKLFINPVITQVPAVVQRMFPILTTSAAFSFKIGASVQGILRPDKIVAYFEDRDSLVETAQRLEKKLKGFSAQCVPFTNQLDEDGLLSWGIDPPQADVFAAVEDGSWRTSVTDQLAIAILQAQNRQLCWAEALPFIRARLFTAGIDMCNWSQVRPETIPVKTG